MNLLLNIESLHPPLTGIGNYTLNLLDQFTQLPGIDSIECFSGQDFCSAEAALARCQAHDQKQAEHPTQPTASRLRRLLRKVPLAYRARAWLHDLQLKRHAERRKHFLYHEPNFILKAHDGPCIATIHDLSFIHYPQYHPAERVTWIGGQLPKTLARADFLITPSEIIRQELIKDHGVAENRVRSIHLGAAECFQPLSQIETQAVMQRHGLTHGGYLLFVASLEPRKGIDVLLEAWCSLPESLRRRWPLVLAGAPGWKNQALQERIEQLQHSHGLRHLHFVPNSELPALYAGAALFIYPSLYEGFGLPVLEAMRCGVPVISTLDTSMAEFAGDSVLLTERGNTEQLAQQLQRLLEDPAARQALADSGLARAQAFSWERCARETLAVYQEVISHHR